MKNKILFILTFSCVGIVGTYWGIRTPDGIINTRAVGVIVGGIIGGPAVGLFSGLLIGLHRMFFLNTFSAFGSGFITILQGLAAGLLSSFIKSKRRMWLWAFLIGLVLESIHMMLLLVVAPPFWQALRLVQEIAPSMLLTNPVATALFIGVMENSLKERDIMITDTARSTFQSVNLLLKALQSGFTSETVDQLAQIIMKAIPTLDYAAILRNGKVTALSLPPGHEDKYDMYKKEVEKFYPLEDKAELEANGLMVLSLADRSDVIGFLVVRKDMEQSYSRPVFPSSERELILGLRGIIELMIEMDRLKKQSSLLAEAEIKVLQTQINPHFLFNALNTIGYFCRSDPLTAKQLLLYLAEYYRHNLNSSNALIPLSKEISHVQAYVNIEQARFGSRLRVEYNIDKCSFSLPPLILQPLVENAIKHGVLPMESGGIVRINITEKPDCYKLCVSDNGVGIPKELLDALLTEHPDEERKSIGLINVHKRLISIYGESSGLHIKSSPGEGTSVSFVIPRKDGEEAS